ncbi:DDE_3 domain-containing protein [Trichonephila clavipes]|nr:DDE_3 domain-containing protein [Trichonephila clavipes]
MVWGTIAYDSRSTLIVMRGTLTGHRYVDDILRPHVGPFLNGLPGTIFQQDNARLHTERVAHDFLLHFQTLPWPARSPDLSLQSTDEAHFWLNGYVNKQNCRIWSEANPQVYVETPLHPEKMTVWCALWAGGIIGPYFFKNDEGHNVTGYVKSLVYADKPRTLDHLEDNFRRVIADSRPQMLEKVIENWTSRLDYIRAIRGSPMPEIIFKL